MFRQRCAWLLLASGILLTSCSGVNPGDEKIATAPSTFAGGVPPTVVFALLADNKLLAVDPQKGTIVFEYSLGTRSSGSSFGHYLALTLDGANLVVLAKGDPGNSDRLFIIAIDTGAVRVEHYLPEGDSFREVLTGPTTGRLYLFGTRGGIATILVLDPSTGQELNDWKTGRGDDFLQAAITHDELQIFVSYHGSGIDRFEVTAPGLLRCRPLALPEASCIGGHGSLLLYQGGLLVETGTRYILNASVTGEVLQSLDTGLPGNHEVHFVTDAARRELYVVGSCRSRGGFSVLDLADESALSAAPPSDSGYPGMSSPKTPRLLRSQVCGENLVAGPEALLVMSRETILGISLQAAGLLIMLDGNTGEEVRSIATTSVPVDIVFASLP